MGRRVIGVKFNPSNTWHLPCEVSNGAPLRYFRDVIFCKIIRSIFDDVGMSRFSFILNQDGGLGTREFTPMKLDITFWKTNGISLISKFSRRFCYRPTRKNDAHFSKGEAHLIYHNNANDVSD